MSLYIRYPDIGGSGGATWGSITGTLSDQLDLQSALDSAGESAQWGSITGTLSAQTDLQSALDEKIEGPASATDNALVAYDGTTGTLAKDQAQVAISPALNEVVFGGGSPATSLRFTRTTNAAGGRILLDTAAQYFVDQVDFGVRLGAPGATYTFRGDIAFFTQNQGVLELGFAVVNPNNRYTIRAGDTVSPGLYATALFVEAGDCAVNSPGIGGGALDMRAGNVTQPSSAEAAGSAFLRGGDHVSSGAAGDVNLVPGTSASGTNGIVRVGEDGVPRTHRLNVTTEAAGASTATLTNSPVAGDPVIYIRININGTEYIMPAWTAP